MNPTLWIEFEQWSFFQRNKWIMDALLEEWLDENTENCNFELSSGEEEHINREVLEQS